MSSYSRAGGVAGGVARQPGVITCRGVESCPAHIPSAPPRHSASQEQSEAHLGDCELKRRAAARQRWIASTGHRQGQPAEEDLLKEWW